jgi:hypothetical protein
MDGVRWNKLRKECVILLSRKHAWEEQKPGIMPVTSRLEGS